MQRSSGKSSTSEIVRPFFRWVGGKQNLVQILMKHVPDTIDHHVYFEPFLGAASLFLAIRPDRAVLSDRNPQLINAFKAVKKSPIAFHALLESHRKHISRSNYLSTRTAFNAERNEDSLIQAVRFVFLAQTSFNGIYRVNERGEFNVPFGRPNPHFPSLEQILVISKKLKRATLKCGVYENVLRNVTRGDFVYLDPPYPPLNGTSLFQHYTASRFSAEAQINLARFVHTLSARGVLVLMSNADVPEIRQLYKSWKIDNVDATRYVSCMSHRKKVRELLIKNY